MGIVLKMIKETLSILGELELRTDFIESSPRASAGFRPQSRSTWPQSEIFIFNFKICTMEVTRPKTSRRWCLTINNPGDSELFLAAVMGYELVKTIKYAAWQLERGASGTDHMQMWLVMGSPCRLAAVVALFPGCHAEVQRGSDEAAEAYVTKMDTRIAGPWTVGDRKSVGQGARVDFKKFVEDLRTGAPLKAIAEAHPGNFIRYHRGARELREILVADRTEAPLVIGYVGPSGCGKTFAAQKYCQDRNLSYWTHSGKNQWFDGYDHQDVAILDEVDKWSRDFGYGRMLRLLDKYPVMVEVKGSSVKFTSKVVIFTGSVPPAQWFLDPGTGTSPKEQLERRINACYTRDDYEEEWREMPLWRAPKVEPRAPAEVVVLSDSEDEEMEAEEFVFNEDGFMYSQ